MIELERDSDYGEQPTRKVMTSTVLASPDARRQRQCDERYNAVRSVTAEMRV